ncbi:MAG TPA: DUF938 domain-containing protein [Casimicrobiaceae bacterium]|nr:DUF938 domain-containing protein [Casimicrobiaceae bacterium]
MAQVFGEQLPDGRWFSAAAQRNQGPILEVLQRVLPASGAVLEIASGTGQHVAHFASALPDLAWQPSDPMPDCRRSIATWVGHLPNVRPPIVLDVQQRPWPFTGANAVLCINMLHVAPWSATEALLAGAAEALAPDGILFVYGPFRRADRPTAPTNEAFDAQLRARDPAWGLRDLERVVASAAANALELAEVAEMPANNLSVVFRKSPAMALRRIHP